MKNIYILLFVIFVSCNGTNKEGEIDNSNKVAAKVYFPGKCSIEPTTTDNGIKLYEEEVLEDEIGVVKRYRYYKLRNSSSCYRREEPLTNFEKGIRKRARQNIQCEPQNEILNEVFLRSANNYYAYKNNKIFLHLDPHTGIYRRVYFGENENGQTVHSKEIGCFWLRIDQEDELWGAVDFGLQLYIDQPKSAKSNVAMANEIYRIDSMGTEWEMTSNDQTFDWEYTFCPHLSIPWGYCDLLRNGNIMFYPSGLTDNDMNNLLNEALLIRTKHNFLQVSDIEFEEAWSTSQSRLFEEPHINYKYAVKFNPDGPVYTEQAWIEYIKDERPMMPEVRYQNNRLICYNGYQEVVLDSGNTAFIEGEVCYENGNYIFTESN